MIAVLNASKYPYKVHAHTSSVLIDGFNSQWAEMLNTPDIKNFCMIHADIGADAGWIDTLHAEMDNAGLDVLSAVVPIKDDSGDTSTAILKPDQTVERLALFEIAKLPVTFTMDDVTKILGYEGTLLVNTGLWIARYGEWMREFPGFDTESKIVCNDGVYSTVLSTEDWAFSVWAQEKGLRVGATTAVNVLHMGKKAWSVRTS